MRDAGSEQVSAEFVITTAGIEDREDWLLLWRHYQVSVSPDVDELTWARIITAGEPIGCLVARRPNGTAFGFINYVLHPSTWVSGLVCYLQDLFVVAAARRQGAGATLLNALIARGLAEGWYRIEVTTSKNNEDAARLYRRVGRLSDRLRFEIALPIDRHESHPR
jgi:GNAT superfamily N-acetyltransferase